MRSDLGRAQPDPFAGLVAAHSSRFRVGGVLFEVSGHRSADVTLVPPLVPFRVETGISDINIEIERVARLPLGSGRELFDSGSIWRLREDQGGFQFDFSTPFFGQSPYKRLIVDHEFRRASLLLRDECFAGATGSAAPLDYPLDEVLITHRLALEQAIELHGCGIVGPDGASNLFVGHSGAGKSTTARLWMGRKGVEVLSDDRIILRRKGVRPANARQQAGEIVMYGTPWHGEAAFASPGSSPLGRIFILEHGRGNRVTRLSPSQAVAELFARSFVPLHGHEFVNSALEFLQDVVGRVGCYRYVFEPDQRAVERILEFCD